MVRPDSGIPGPVEEGFGAFEPRFYGITIRLQTPKTYQAWASFSGFCPSKPLPPLSTFDAVCLQTAIEHETRHFHDALISPFANGILMLRMQAAYNGVQFLARARTADANCLPVPIIGWMTKSAVEREALIQDWEYWRPESLSTPVRPVSVPLCDGGWGSNYVPGFHAVPDDPEQALHAFAHASAEGYRAVASLMRGPTVLLRDNPAFAAIPEAEKRRLEAIITPRNVFEVSALAVQLQAAWTNIDAAAADSFGSYLLTADAGYADAFRWVAKLTAEGGSNLDLKCISAAAVWSLMGAPAPQRDSFDPAVRLARVSRLIDSEGLPAFESVAELWDLWDRALDVTGWRKALLEMHARTERSTARYRALTTDEGEREAAVFASVLECYCADQRRLIDLLLRDPDAYVDPRRYVETTCEALPMPLGSIELGVDLARDTGFVVPIEKVFDSASVRLPGVLEKNGERGWFRAVLDRQEPPRPTLLDDALRLEFWCKLSDIAFSDEALTPFEREVFRQSVRKGSGLEPMSVY